MFVDVIQAYKGIQKEKEALEASLKALAEAKNSADGNLLLQDQDEIQTTDEDMSANSEGTSTDVSVCISFTCPFCYKYDPTIIALL